MMDSNKEQRRIDFYILLRKRVQQTPALTKETAAAKVSISGACAICKKKKKTEKSSAKLCNKTLARKKEKQRAEEKKIRCLRAFARKIGGGREIGIPE